MFEVTLSPEAQAFSSDADKPLARVSRCFSKLECEPRRHNNIQRVTGGHSGLSRYRVGDWRVNFRIDDAVNKVLVLSIAIRWEVY